jgi:hypothetical protein
MPNATPRANARTLSKTPPPKPETRKDAILRALDAEALWLKKRAEDAERVLAGRAAPVEIEALAAEFEAAWTAERDHDVNRTNEESDAAADREAKILEKIAALPPGDMSTIRLKARAYMWGENAYDLEEFGGVQADSVTGPVLVSLFRDLGVDAPPEAAVAGSPSTSAEAPDLLDVGNDLHLVHDLLDAAHFAAGTLPSGLGKEPILRLLNVITDKLADARNDLDRIREATDDHVLAQEEEGA